VGFVAGIVKRKFGIRGRRLKETVHAKVQDNSLDKIVDHVMDDAEKNEMLARAL
jgi:hypothetical protein